MFFRSIFCVFAALTFAATLPAGSQQLLSTRLASPTEKLAIASALAESGDACSRLVASHPRIPRSLSPFRLQGVPAGRPRVFLSRNSPNSVKRLNPTKKHFV